MIWDKHKAIELYTVKKLEKRSIRYIKLELGNVLYLL